MSDRITITEMCSLAPHAFKDDGSCARAELVNTPLPVIDPALLSHAGSDS